MKAVGSCRVFVGASRCRPDCRKEPFPHRLVLPRTICSPYYRLKSNAVSALHCHSWAFADSVLPAKCRLAVARHSSAEYRPIAWHRHGLEQHDRTDQISPLLALGNPSTACGSMRSRTASSTRSFSHERFARAVGIPISGTRVIATECLGSTRVKTVFDELTGRAGQATSAR